MIWCKERQASKGSPVYGIFWTSVLTVIISALLDFDILNQAISAGILLMQGFVCVGCVLRRIRRGIPKSSDAEKMGVSGLI
mmetsp:Transcript_6995/g.5798  ORF Transcript_6995/g.5798 Transcript_6995/m.5798 type:complete len:81 (-) Transcript_6995:89-331(-)